MSHGHGWLGQAGSTGAGNAMSGERRPVPDVSQITGTLDIYAWRRGEHASEIRLNFEQKWR